MGVSNSSELHRSFQDISSWQWSRVISTIKSYKDGEYDFGIDKIVIVTLTGCTLEEASAVVEVHAKGGSSLINAITWLVSIIIMSDSDRRHEIIRMNALFDIVDFNEQSQISMDEFTILLLCVMTSFSIILNKKDDIPSDANMIQYSNFVYEQLGKPRGANISKDEFSGWIKSEFLDSQKFTVELLHASISERISTLPEKALTDGRPKTANA